MASSGNFCTWNPNDCVSSLKFNTGNLSTDQDNNDWRGMFGTHPFTSGKWYWEAYQNSNNSNNGFPVAIQRASDGLNYLMWSGSNAYLGRAVGTYGYSYAIYTNAPTYSEKRHNNSSTNTNLSAGTTGDIYQLAVDLDAGKIWFGKNNTWADSGDPANGSNEAFSSIPAGTYVPASVTWNSSGSDNFVSNWGQDDTFGGAITAAGNADGNGHGVFKYSPPTGFLALCSANLSISDDIDPAQTDTNYPGKLIGTSNWSGSGGSKSITGLGFQPDLTIIKAADAASSDWALFDSSRGVQKLLEPNTTTAEETNSNSLTAFGADGFTVGSDSRVNDSGRLMTAQSWICNAGTTASNSDGASTTTVQANTKAGFSIIETPNYSSNSTFGHGLSSAPEFVIAKLTGGSQWVVYHKGLTSAGYYVALNTTNAQASGSFFNSTAPTSSVFSLGASFGGSGAGICYAWHSVEGYSKFSSYVGNGDADGPFIYTGHMPRCVWIKRTDSSAEWAVYFWNDTSVNSSYVSLKRNPLDSRLTFDAGSMNNGEPVDFLSNGFKIRDSDAIVNASSGNYLYCSWGSVPFKYNNTF